MAISLNIFKKKTVLIIEDDKALRKVLCDKIHSEGWNVFEAPDGREGLSSAIQNHPDVILLDLMLPQMDGISLLEELRKDEWGIGAKVLIMSNLVKGAALLEQVKKYHAADFIEKADMSLDIIVEKIRKLL